MTRAPLLAVVWALAACPQPAEPPAVSEYVVDCNRADAGEHFATDEAYVKFIESEAAGKWVKDACQAPRLLGPEVATKLSAATPSAFSFAARGAVCALPPARGKSLLGALLGLIIGEAHAHCPAVSGDNYLFRLTRSGEKTPLYSAMLSTTSFTPSTGAWTKAMKESAGQRVELTIARASFLRGSLAEGPYVQPAPWVFEVGP